MLAEARNVQVRDANASSYRYYAGHARRELWQQLIVGELPPPLHIGTPKRMRWSSELGSEDGTGHTDAVKISVILPAKNTALQSRADGTSRIQKFTNNDMYFRSFIENLVNDEGSY